MAFFGSTLEGGSEMAQQGLGDGRFADWTMGGLTGVPRKSVHFLDYL